MSPPPLDATGRRALRRGAAKLRRAGYRLIAGTDEAGAGPLAGPLVAAAVILPAGARLPGVNDSKQLTPAEREHWAERIRLSATAWAVASVAVEEIDRVGPLRGAILAMTRSVRALDPQPDYLLVDARRLPGLDMPQEAVIRGDARHLAIAAASILAKVERDGEMVRLDRRFPGYGLARHKGYGTAEHLEALRRFGPAPCHRRSYAPVRRCLAAQRSLFDG